MGTTLAVGHGSIRGVKTITLGIQLQGLLQSSVVLIMSKLGEQTLNRTEDLMKEEIQKEVVKSVQEMLGISYEVQPREVRKNNDILRRAVKILKDGENNLC